MPITQVPQYAGDIPAIGQNQPTFNQNTADMFNYIGEIANGINTTAGEIDTASASVDQNRTLAEDAANSAVSVVNFAGDFTAGVTNAVAGNSYKYEGGYWACLSNTTETPAYDNANWEKKVSQADLNAAEERSQGVGVRIYRGTGTTNGQRHVQNGDTVPAGTTHLSVLIGGKVEDVAMSPIASGGVSLLTETSATIGGVPVTLHRFLNGGYQATDAELETITPLVGEQWFNTTDNTIHVGDGVTLGGIKHVNLNNISNYTDLVFENVEKLKIGELVGGGTTTFSLHQTLSTGFMSFRVSAVSGIPLTGGLYAAPIGPLMLGEFGLVPDDSDPATATYNASIVQEAVDLSISFRKELIGNGSNYYVDSTIYLAGVSVSANDLTIYGNNTKLINITSGINGLELNGRSHVTLDKLNIELPEDEDGSGGVCIEFKGTTGWNRIEDCVFRGGLHAVYSNNSAIFATTFENNRMYSQYSSHVRFISDGAATTLSFRNNQTDGCKTRNPAWYFNIASSGNGVENLELTMNSADDCVQALYVRSRYATVKNFYTERIRGEDFQSGDRLFRTLDTFESGELYGLRASFSTNIPAETTNVALLETNGFKVESCRLNVGLEDTTNQSSIITGSKTTQILNTRVASGTYGIYAQGPVITTNLSGNLALNPASTGNVVDLGNLVNCKTTSTSTSNSTDDMGLVFMAGGLPVPYGAISNGVVSSTINAFAAIVPYATGSGNRQGGLKFLCNASTVTNALTERWFMNQLGAFVPTVDDTVNVGGTSNRVSNIYLVNAPSVTSDERFKTEIEDISEKLKRVASCIQIKRFKYADSIAKKGDEARIHFGVSAQSVIDAFESEGLDAMDYACVRKVPLSEDFDGDYSSMTEDEFRYEVVLDEILSLKISML